MFSDFYFGRLVVTGYPQTASTWQYRQFGVRHHARSLALVMYLASDNSLAKIMQQVKGNSAYQIQKIRREWGAIPLHQPLWQDGYHDHALRKEEDLQQLARYIVAQSD